VNNLPKVVTWKRNGQESNHDPLSCESNVITTTPPGHLLVHFELVRFESIYSSIQLQYITCLFPR